MKKWSGFSWYAIIIVTLIGLLKMNDHQSRAAEPAKKPPLVEDWFRTWASFGELKKWVREQDPERHPTAEPLIHYRGQQREMAVWFYRWPTGVRRTEFTVYHRTKDGWQLLLRHNVIEHESLIAERRKEGLGIKAEKSGKTILFLPD